VRPARELVHLAPVGELDFATVERLREQLEQLVDAGFGHVVVDLRGLVFIDLTGLRLLLRVHADAQRDGWRLSLIQGPQAIRRIFELTGTLAVLPFHTPTAISQRRH
jgi:anti-sigma B factor antagonist